ncbi:MAG: benzoate-CoA ligase family protein [Deltaproteobacteria bacterium]|nr:benzoate-CoA ligase family protein [Deltaproteobacteria bacterium]
MAPPTFPELFNLADYCLFNRLKEGRGNHTAVRFGNRSYTYDLVATVSRALRGHLLARGVTREGRVLLLLHDTPAYPWALFGALHHGCVVAMGNPDAPPADLAYLVEYTRAQAVIALTRTAVSLGPALRDDDLLRTVVLVPEVETGGDVTTKVEHPEDLQGLPVSSLQEALAEGKAHMKDTPRPTRRDEVALWLFTSGSTGKPKAAMHAHRDFAFNTEVYAKGTVGYRPEDVTVSVPRLFFGYATGTNLFFPFAVGATTALFAERPTPEVLCREIERHRPTVVTNVPTMMAKLLDEDLARTAVGKEPLDLSGVRFHLSAGEALPPTLLSRFTERFKTDVYDGIGSAELFHIYCTNRPGDVKPGSLGRAVEGYTLRILSSDAEGPGAPELPTGETGVLWVKGDSVAFGYFHDRDKSWGTFHGHWCRTGDLFRIDGDGYLWFSGRADDLLKVGGVWVAPTEVEECLLQHPAVSLAAVLGYEDEGLVKPKAYVVLRDDARVEAATEEGARVLAEALKAHVKERLSPHKYPRRVVFVGELPRTDRGKVDKKSLKDAEARGEAPRGY